MIESLVLAVPAAAAGFVVAYSTIHLGVRLLFATMPAGLADVARHVASLEPDVRVFAFSVAAGLSSAVRVRSRACAPGHQNQRGARICRRAGAAPSPDTPSRCSRRRTSRRVSVAVDLWRHPHPQYGPSGKYGDRCKCTLCARSPDSRRSHVPRFSPRWKQARSFSALRRRHLLSRSTEGRQARPSHRLADRKPFRRLIDPCRPTTSRYSTCLSRRDALFRGQKPLPADRSGSCRRRLHALLAWSQRSRTVAATPRH